MNADSTPPTRSYVDALLQGLSEDELACLRAEIGGKRAEPEDDDDPRTHYHAYTAEERRSARRTLQQVVADDDEDDARTTFHAYTPEERRSARPSESHLPVGAPVDDDDDDVRTLFRAAAANATRSPSAPARPASMPAGPSSARGISGPRLGASLSARPPVPPVPPASSDRRAAIARTPPPPADPVADLDDLLADIPGPSATPDEVPISSPSLRSFDQRTLDSSYLEAIGGPGSIPRIAVSVADLRRLPLGAAEGFLVSCIDGQCSVDDLIDISGLSRVDTLRILYGLLQQGVISVGG